MKTEAGRNESPRSADKTVIECASPGGPAGLPGKCESLLERGLHVFQDSGSESG
jgi:hypothetical protein